MVLLATNNPQCGLFKFAPAYNLEVQLFTPDQVKDGEAWLTLLQSHSVDLVVLAGYLKLVPEAVVKAFPRRILNLHPSLLPKFGGKGMYGMRVHEAVLAAGDEVSGITVHYVDEAYDRGEVVFQTKVPVIPGMTPELLQQAVQKLEHQYLPGIVLEQARLLAHAHISMENSLQVRSALVSVYHKEGLDSLALAFRQFGIQAISTGGTADYLRGFGLEVLDVADLTGYPSILGGRVKTLHPKVHGGILARRDDPQDLEELAKYEIPTIDLVVVDLYPFEQTVRETNDEDTIIEKIDIGGIALIRGAAKNFAHAACIPSQAWYAPVAEWLMAQGGSLTLAQRKQLAGASFEVSSHYDSQIYRYFDPQGEKLKISAGPKHTLRYGENPHQTARYYGDLDHQFHQLNGKELSYNNLVDLDAAIQLCDEFEEPAFVVIKHTNPCGCAIANDLKSAWERALAADPTSAFGGILAANRVIDLETAKAVDQIFFEALVAPGFSDEALEVLKKKKNRILLHRKAQPGSLAKPQVRSLLGGYLMQDADRALITPETMEVKTSRQPLPEEMDDILFGEIVCKHLKSNAIALVRDQQLIGAGMGQTSRIDSLRQAFAKAESHGFDPRGAVLVSDAFFPFSDSVEYAFQQGIKIVVEPGGSIRDEETINFCETNDMCLIFTGLRHFLH